jgi:hypothetical protein
MCRPCWLGPAQGLVGLSKVLAQHPLMGRSWRRMRLRWWVQGVPVCLHPSGCQFPSKFLEGLPGGVDCLIIRFALTCWKYRMREARNDHLDGCVLHLDALGGPECLCALLRWKCGWTGVPKRRKCCLRAIALSSTVLVIINELHFD